MNCLVGVAELARRGRATGINVGYRAMASEGHFPDGSERAHLGTPHAGRPECEADECHDDEARQRLHAVTMSDERHTVGRDFGSVGRNGTVNAKAPLTPNLAPPLVPNCSVFETGESVWITMNWAAVPCLSAMMCRASNFATVCSISPMFAGRSASLAPCGQALSSSAFTAQWPLSAVLMATAPATTWSSCQDAPSIRRLSLFRSAPASPRHRVALGLRAAQTGGQRHRKS